MIKWFAPTKLMPTARSADNRQTRGSLASLLNLHARERARGGAVDATGQLSVAVLVVSVTAEMGGSRSGRSGWCAVQREPRACQWQTCAMPTSRRPGA